MENPPNTLRKGRTGQNKELREELFKNSQTETIFQKIKEEIVEIVQQHYLTSSKVEDEELEEIRIGIGCNSGKHRSVAFVERIYEELSKEFYNKGVEIVITHRDIQRSGDKNDKRKKK